MIINTPLEIDLEGAKYTKGATKLNAATILKGIAKDIALREREILNDLAEVRQNVEVPADYLIYEFYDAKGDGFEAGKTPTGYSITN